MGRVRVPRAARLRGTGGVSFVPVDQVFGGEVFRVGAGGVVPMDGWLLAAVGGVVR